MQNGCHDFETAILRKSLIYKRFASTRFYCVLRKVNMSRNLIAPPAARTTAAGYNTRPRRYRVLLQ